MTDKPYKPKKPRIMGGARQLPHIIVVTHEKVRVCGMWGETNLSLEGIAAELPRRMEGVEVFPIQTEPEIVYLPVLSFEPLIDMAFCRSKKTQGTNLITTSLNHHGLVDDVRRIASIAGIRYYLYSRQFEEELQEFMRDRVKHYGRILSPSRERGVALSTAFGVYTYADLLNRYRGKTLDEAITIARRKFGMGV